MQAAYLKIVAGVVENRLVVDPVDFPQWQLVADRVGVDIGDLYDGVNFTKPADYAARLAERVRIADIDAEVEGDAVMANIKTLTNAQIDAWFTANITDLASARVLLRRLTKIIIRKVL